jgi:hypothetical protein
MQMAAMQPAMTPVTTSVQQRTRMGLMFDVIRIPMPIIRPVAIPQPAEMTMTMPVAQTQAVMPMATAPMMTMMPMAPTQMVPMMPMAGANMGMFANQQAGGAQMNISGQMSVQQATILMMAARGELTPQTSAMLLSLIGSGNLTQDQLNTLIQQITSQLKTTQAPAPQPAIAAPNVAPARTVAAAPVDVRSQRPAANTATDSTQAPSAASNAQAAAALQEQLRVAEQKLKYLEDNWHPTPK